MKTYKSYSRHVRIGEVQISKTLKLKPFFGQRIVDATSFSRGCAARIPSHSLVPPRGGVKRSRGSGMAPNKYKTENVKKKVLGTRH